MDSYHNSNLPYTQTEFSSYAFSKSIGAKKSRWISPSPKRKNMTSIIASKKNGAKNHGTSTTQSLERNFLKRKSPFAISDIDSNIKRLEALHEETTTSDSDTTITKINSLSKRRKLSKPGADSSNSEDLCKTLKSVNNTVNKITLLKPFNREEDIKIIMYFHKFMELLAHKDDIYVYQLLEMKYHFQRSAKFLQDRFLNEILPNLYVYDCLSLEDMVIFYDRADMLVPKHVQNMIHEKVRCITGHGINLLETQVITISDSENEETHFIENENVKSPCSSKSSLIIPKRRNRTLQLSSSPSICSINISENALQTVQNPDKDSCNNSPSVMSESHLTTINDSENKETNLIEYENIRSPCSSESSLILSNRKNKQLKLPSSICSTRISEKKLHIVRNSDSDSCINSEVLSVMSSVNKEPNSVNVVNMCDSANHKIVETCQLVKDSDLNLCDENKRHRNVKDSKKEHSNNINRDKEVENITTNTCDTTEGSSDYISSSCLFETSEKLQVKCAKNFNKQNAKHEKLITMTTNLSKTVQSSNCNPIEVTKSSQTIQNDQSHDNFMLHTDHTYVKLTEIIDKSPDNVNVQQVPDNTSTFSSETVGIENECISIKFPDNICITKSAETSSLEQKIEHSVKSISKRSFVDANTNTEALVTKNKQTQLSLVDSNNIDSISCIEQILTEKNMKDNNSGYNLRKFVKNPRGGTRTRRKIHWFGTETENVLDLLTKDCSSKVIKKPTTISKRTQKINKMFAIRKLQHRKSKFRKEINKVLWSPASDQSDETVSSETSSRISDTSTTTNSDNEICVKLSTGIVIRKTYLKNNNKSKFDNQIGNASPVTEEFNQPVSTVTSTNVVNQSVSPGSDSDKPVITEVNTNTSICNEPKSDNQINKISPLITEKSNHCSSTVTSTSVSNNSLEDSTPENDIIGIKNNFEKREHKKLEYVICKPDSSPISEESNQSAAKKLVYLQINKNTGNLLGMRPVGKSTDKKVISSTGTSKAISTMDNVNDLRLSESANLTSTVSGSDNTINTRIDKTVSEETISSSDSRANAFYHMEINIFEDLPCENDDESVQQQQNLVKKTNEIIVSTSRTIRNPALSECTDEYSVIKPTRTYTRKTARVNPADYSCTVSVKTEPDDSQVKLEPLDSSDDSGLEMIASQLLLRSPIAGTSCARASPCSSASDDVIIVKNSPNCILDFLVDDVEIEMDQETSMPPTNIRDPIYETVPVNKEDVNITNHSFSTISEADSVWCTIKRIISIFESPIVWDDSESASKKVVVKSQITQTDANITSTTCNEETDVQIKQELIELNETIKQEWITDSDSWDNYPEMIFDCAKIKQEISILESNTITSPYFDEENFDPVLPVQLPNENVQSHINMSRKLQAVVAENRLSINHLNPVTETEFTTEQIIKTEDSAATELE